MWGIHVTFTAAGKHSFSKQHNLLNPPRKTLQLCSVLASRGPLSAVLSCTSKEAMSSERHIWYDRERYGSVVYIIKHFIYILYIVFFHVIYSLSFWSSMQRRNTHRGAAGSPLSFVAGTFALGQRTLQTQGGEKSEGRHRDTSGYLRKDGSLRLTPSSANAVCGARNTRMSRCC